MICFSVGTHAALIVKSFKKNYILYSGKILQGKRLAIIGSRELLVRRTLANG